MNCLDVKCPFPIRPDNGFVNYPAKEALSYKDKATYGCHDTYVLDGPEEVECNKFGNWSAQPSCKGMKHGWVLKYPESIQWITLTFPFLVLIIFYLLLRLASQLLVCIGV